MRAASESGRPPVGGPLRPVIEEALELAARLRPMAAGAAAEGLERLSLDLTNQVCRIAVIGQVKAGKSSLINALVRRRGLSPANINPWTAVVSRFHFGMRSPSGANAEFTFFDEDDWRNLAAGGRLQEMSARIGLPVDQDTLASQVGQMRARAERRLGRQFHHLLGQQHRFAAASAEVLARYVCVGDLDTPADRDPAPMTGRFSDITKSADLYFDLPPFALPTMIIDTPGTNDPFLVRDDMTRRALDGADAFIVVLTAQQALSATDLAMLRLLHGLHKQRMVVFVNRIDLLDDVARDTQRVVSHVRRRLAAEFPLLEIPVIAGSAHWGELILNDERHAGPAHLSALEALPPTLLAYARHRGALPTDGAGRATPDEVTLACSAMPDLERALSVLMLGGPAMLRLQRTLASLQAFASDIEVAAGNQEKALAQAAEIAARDETSSGQRAAELDRQIQALEPIASAVANMAAILERELNIVVKGALLKLGAGLNNAVRDFAEQQGKMMREAAVQQRQGGVWRCDTRVVRSELERTFLRIYGRSAAELQHAEQRAAERLRSKIGRRAVEANLDLAGRQVHVVDPAPSIAALGQAVALDLGDQWERWWQVWRTPAQRMRRLKEVIVAEFEPIAAALVDSAAAELEGHVTVTVQRMAVVHGELLGALDLRRKRLARIRHELRPEGERRRLAMLTARYQVQRKRHLEQLDACRSIGGALRRLGEQCAMLAAGKVRRDETGH